MKGSWDFVEEYYPNYSGCSEIARNNDLEVIVNNEVEDDSCAAQQYNELALYLGCSSFERREAGSEEDLLVHREAEKLLNESLAIVYQRAIEGYLATLKTED